MRPNGLPKDVPEEKTLEQIGRALAECGAFAKEHGVEIWVEVHGEQHEAPVAHAPDHGRLRPPERRPDLELERHRRVRRLGRERPSSCSGPSSAAATSPTCASGYPYRELFALLGQSGFAGFTLCEYPQPVPASRRARRGSSDYRERWEAHCEAGSH